MSLKKLQNQLDSKHLLSTKHWGRQNFMTCQTRCFSIATSLSSISTPTNLLNFNSWQGVLVLKKKQNEKTPPSGFVQHHRWILPSVLHYGLWYAAATFGLCRGVTCPCPTGASSVFFRVIGKKWWKKSREMATWKNYEQQPFPPNLRSKSQTQNLETPDVVGLDAGPRGKRHPIPRLRMLRLGRVLRLVRLIRVIPALKSMVYLWLSIWKVKDAKGEPCFEKRILIEIEWNLCILLQFFFCRSTLAGLWILGTYSYLKRTLTWAPTLEIPNRNHCMERFRLDASPVSSLAGYWKSIWLHQNFSVEFSSWTGLPIWIAELCSFFRKVYWPPHHPQPYLLTGGGRGVIF